MASNKVKQNQRGLQALVWQEGDLYVAKTVEIELASQGATKEEALNNLSEAIDLYFENEPAPLKNLSKLPNLTLEHITPESFNYA